MFRFKILSIAVVAMLALAVSGSAQNLYSVSTTNSWGGYTYGNGDKVANGRFNTLHTVWEDGALVKYSTSADGAGWTGAEIVAPGLPSAMPAIASDSNGTVVVAFVGNPDAQGLGGIYYAYKTWGGTSWTVSKIVNSGTQPDIEARSGKVYVTWTTFQRVQYTSFSTTAPPAAMNLGEEIEFTACDGTGFVRPSVALVRESCELVPKVGYLRYSDETTNPDAACTSLITEVGARVCARDQVAGTWGLEFSDVVTATAPMDSVEAVALSMNAQYSTGNTFVAWSDISDGAARTRLAHGRNGTWDAITHNSDKQHVHVAAKRNSSAGDFRLTWISSDWNPWLPFVDVDGQFRTGQWNSGTTPTWTDPTSTWIADAFGGTLAGQPQATFWSKCSSGLYDTVEVVTELEEVCFSQGIAAHRTEDQSCPSGGVIGINPCWEVYAVYQASDLLLTHIDVDGLGDPVELGQSWATFRVRVRDGEGRVRISWDRGRVTNTWEGGFSIDNPRARVRVESEGVDAELVRLRPNYQYDGVKPAVCEKR